MAAPVAEIPDTVLARPAIHSGSGGNPRKYSSIIRQASIERNPKWEKDLPGIHECDASLLH